MKVREGLWVVGAFIGAHTAAPAGAQQRPPFEFRGHHLGDAPWDGMSRPVACDPVLGSPNQGDMDCEDLATAIGTADVEVSYRFLDSALVSVQIAFDPDDFQEIAGAFQEKYGRPDAVSASPFKTVGGASYRNEIHLWHTATGDLTLQRYYERATTGSAYIISPKGKRRLREKITESHKRARKDL